MTTRKAKALWQGTLREGKGEMNLSGYKGAYTYASRFEEGEGTNPEELLGAAIAGCYSMFLSALISAEKITPLSIETTANVVLESDETGPCITRILLETRVDCPGLSQEKFEKLSLDAKGKCPVSRLYSGGTAQIELSALLKD